MQGEKLNIHILNPVAVCSPPEKGKNLLKLRGKKREKSTQFLLHLPLTY